METLSHCRVIYPSVKLFCLRTGTLNTLHLNNTFICFTIFDLDYSCGISLKYVRCWIKAVFEFSFQHSALQVELRFLIYIKLKINPLYTTSLILIKYLFKNFLPTTTVGRKLLFSSSI